MSIAGLQALRVAVTEARWRSAPLFAVRACAFRPPWTGPDVERVRTQLRREARQYVCDAFDAAMGGVPHDVTVYVDLANARIDEALLAASDNPSDVLIVGRHTQRRPSNWLIRSCMRHACCPVVIVPPPSGLPEIANRRMARRLLREISRQQRAVRAIVGQL
jgi:nucleotide-binding universal stress UspA family protein